MSTGTTLTRAPDAPPHGTARHATRPVDGLPVHVLQVREGRDDGRGQRRRDTPRRAYPVTPETEPCPYCRATSGVQSTPAPPRVQAWSCTACRTDWAITAVNPRPYFDRLSATVEQLGATRSVLRQVITLADDAATLSDSELRDRLLALAARARLVQRTALTVQGSGVKTAKPQVGDRAGHL